MADEVPTTDPAVDSPGGKDAKKKKDKVRSAWISFVGRIIAQVLGAVATVVLGLFVLQRYAAPPPQAPAPASPSADSARRATAARSRAADGISLAVLPLANLSADPMQGYFADGVTEALITDLARIEGLHVISRTSSMFYKDQKKPLPEIADELGVKWIVEGSVLRAGTRVRITAQLIDADLDRHVWAQAYDRAVGDVLALQAEVAAAIAKEVHAVLTPRVERRFAQRPPVEPDAYDLYLKGRDAWAQRTPEALLEAAKYFEQAIERDSNFALAYAGLAEAYGLFVTYADERATYEGLRDAQAKARAAAQKALEIDDGLGRAHASLAWVERNDWNWQAAEREFRRALELNPHHVTAHQWYAVFLAEQGRDEEALQHAEEAVRTDPLSSVMHQTLGLVHYYGRRHDRAVAAERRALELAPGAPFARAFLARALLEQRKYQDAIRVCEESVSDNLELLTALGVAYLRAGDGTRAEALRRRLAGRRRFPAGALARWLAAAADRPAAFEMLNRLSNEKLDTPSLKTDPLLDPLRDDPRFSALIQRVYS